MIWGYHYFRKHPYHQQEVFVLTPGPKPWWRTKEWIGISSAAEVLSLVARGHLAILKMGGSGFERAKNVVWLLNKMVVSNIFYFHPYLGKIPNLTNIFQRGWNHQLVNHWTCVMWSCNQMVVVFWLIIIRYGSMPIFCCAWMTSWLAKH